VSVAELVSNVVLLVLGLVVRFHPTKALQHHWLVKVCATKQSLKSNSTCNQPTTKQRLQTILDQAKGTRRSVQETERIEWNQSRDLQERIGKDGREEGNQD